MNQLVPEPRTDRNGRTQTRWVRPGTAAPAAALPTPSLGESMSAAESDRAAITVSILEAVGNWAYMSGLDDVVSYSDRVGDALPKLSRATLHALEAALHDEDSRPMAFNLVADDDGGWTTDEELHSALAYAGAFDGLLTQPSEVVSIVMGLRELGLGWANGRPKLPYELEGRGRDEALALCKVTAAVSDIWWAIVDDHPLKNRLSEEPMYLANPELVALVRERPERAEEICSVIVARRSADPSVLRGVLDAPRPLADGSL